MNDTTPQFGSAEYSNVPGSERCVLCKELIGASYFRINNKMVCVGCGEKVKNGQPVEDGSSYVRALGFGAAGAFAGFVLYATVSIVTGWQIGFVSLAVGFLVAWA